MYEWSLTHTIDYTGNAQLVIKNPTTAQIEVDNIEAIRCDGLVEYSYEYNGVPLLGDDVWDITDGGNHPSTHNSIGFSPASQRNVMDFISQS